MASDSLLERPANQVCSEHFDRSQNGKTAVVIVTAVIAPTRTVAGLFDKRSGLHGQLPHPGIFVLSSSSPASQDDDVESCPKLSNAKTSKLIFCQSDFAGN
jgi:hypothetical protein